MKRIIRNLFVALISVFFFNNCGGPEPQENVEEYKLENNTSNFISLKWSDTTISKEPNGSVSIPAGGFTLLQRDKDFDINPFGTADSIIISFDNQKNLVIYKNDTTAGNILNLNNYQVQKLEDGSIIRVKSIDEQYYNLSK